MGQGLFADFFEFSPILQKRPDRVRFPSPAPAFALSLRSELRRGRPTFSLRSELPPSPFPPWPKATA